MDQPNHKERTHALLSASSAHRWLVCPPSAVASELYPNQDTEFTREGTLAHEVAELCARKDEVVLNEFLEQHNDVPQEMVEYGKDYADYIEESKKSNNAFTLLERRVDFSKWVPQGFGTCDCILIDDETLTVIDYKYGAGVKVEAHDNPQMKLYALGALNDYGYAFDIKNVELHIYQPRMNNVSTFALSVEELLTWAESIKPIALQASKGEGEYQPGEHCKFCAHAGKCRALTSLCTEHVNVHGLKVDVPVLAPHEIAEILRVEPLITLALKRVRDQAMTTLLDGGEIPGYKVVEGRGTRAWTDEFKVADTLKANGYSWEDFTKTEILSPAAMEKALGKKKANELLADLVEKKQGALSVALDTDKRPSYNRLADIKNDFD